MIRLELLGGFRVTVGQMVAPDDMWKRRKQASLVKALCLAPQHRMRRDQLADLLRPELPSAAGAANLRKTIHLVRQQMYPGRYVTESIVSTGDMLSLPVEHIWVDVVAFRSQVRQARAAHDLDAARSAADRLPGLTERVRHDDRAGRERAGVGVGYATRFEVR